MTKYFLKKRRNFRDFDDQAHHIFFKEHPFNNLETANMKYEELFKKYLHVTLLLNNYTKFIPN